MKSLPKWVTRGCCVIQTITLLFICMLTRHRHCQRSIIASGRRSARQFDKHHHDNNSAARNAVMSSFLNNINDSDVGCMEARLRPALTYYALYQSTGCRHINDLMHEFFDSHSTTEVADVLSFFAAPIAHHLPVRDDSGNIKPLSWAWVKAHLPTLVHWENIDAEWQSAVHTLAQPQIAQTRHWFFHNFNTSSEALHTWLMSRACFRHLNLS